MKYIKSFIALTFISATLIGCASGNQKINWMTNQPIDKTKGATIQLTTSVEVPAEEMAFMKKDIEEQVAKIMTVSDNQKGAYLLKINITKYDDGNAFLRFLLAGLGQMHLDGDVQVLSSNPSTTVKEGKFEKSYSWGGFVGLSARMHNDMNTKVGKAVAEGIQEEPVKK